MRTSFTSFCRKILASAKLAVSSQLEYRLNFAVDAIVQPVCTAVIEMLVWSSIFQYSKFTQLAGFSQEMYLGYALWAAFFARNTANWLYEFRMIEEIESGTVNSILVRPISFFEFYLGQFLGYKIVTSASSLLVPLIIGLILHLPLQLSQLPGVILLSIYYLVFVHAIAFTISSLAFFFTRIHSFTVAKNISLWILTGELFPLDLIPEPYRHWVISLPFSSAVYIPVGVLTGRLPSSSLAQGFVSITLGLLVLGGIGSWIWSKGRRAYSGTGA